MLIRKRHQKTYNAGFVVVLFISCIIFNQALRANSVIGRGESNDRNATIQQWGRDPFTPSQLMYQQVGVQDGRENGIFSFIPSNENLKIPTMRVQGLIQKGDTFVALLEVQGVGTFMVREGDEFNIDPSQPRNAIRISKITRLSVIVETGRLGSIRVLR